MNWFGGKPPPLAALEKTAVFATEIQIKQWFFKPCSAAILYLEEIQKQKFIPNWSHLLPGFQRNKRKNKEKGERA